jgi:hypothetical protein
MIPIHPSLAIIEVSHEMGVYWVGNDGSIQATVWFDATGWDHAAPITPPGVALPGVIIPMVHSFARAAPHMDLYWVGPDGSIKTTGLPSTTIIALSAPGTAVPGQIDATWRSTDRFYKKDVFWVNPDGSISSIWWDENTGWAQPFGVTRPGVAQPGAVSVVARTDSHMDLFWVNPDGSISSTWWDASSGWGQPFGVSQPGTAVPGSVNALARTDSHLDVFWVNPDRSISSNWWDSNSGWAQPFGVTLPGAVKLP